MKSRQLSSDMTEVEEAVGRPRDELPESEQRDLLQSWMNAQQAIVQFNHQAKIIQDDAKRVSIDSSPHFGPLRTLSYLPLLPAFSSEENVFLQAKDPYMNIPSLMDAVQSVQATLSTRRDVLKKTFDIWEERKDPLPAPKSSQVTFPFSKWNIVADEDIRPYYFMRFQWGCLGRIACSREKSETRDALTWYYSTFRTLNSFAD